MYVLDILDVLGSLWEFAFSRDRSDHILDALRPERDLTYALTY